MFVRSAAAAISARGDGDAGRATPAVPYTRNYSANFAPDSRRYRDFPGPSSGNWRPGRTARNSPAPKSRPAPQQALLSLLSRQPRRPIVRTSFFTPGLQPFGDMVPGLLSRQLMFFYIQAVLKPAEQRRSSQFNDNGI